VWPSRIGKASLPQEGFASCVGHKAPGEAARKLQWVSSDIVTQKKCLWIHDEDFHHDDEPYYDSNLDVSDFAFSSYVIINIVVSFQKISTYK
jgi:hypothetical protein